MRELLDRLAGLAVVDRLCGFIDRIGPQIGHLRAARIDIVPVKGEPINRERIVRSVIGISLGLTIAILVLGLGPGDVAVGRRVLGARWQPLPRGRACAPIGAAVRVVRLAVKRRPIPTCCQKYAQRQR